jgi:uncharacterized metal-binding protein YceD (DUF177 family)
MTELEWSLSVTEVPSSGRRVTRSASQAERDALARALDIPAIERLDVSGAVRPLSRGRYGFEGRLEAVVVQSCVVTLEPVSRAVDEAIDVIFSPEADNMAPETNADGEHEIEILSAPEVEPIDHGRMDLGRVVFEVLSAGLDPYPRREGAEFDWTDPVQATGAASPFAALAKLKDKP